MYEYALVHWDPNEADKKKCLGICNRFNMEIAVRDDLPQNLSFAETLEHEINHACYTPPVWTRKKTRRRSSTA